MMNIATVYCTRQEMDKARRALQQACTNIHRNGTIHAKAVLLSAYIELHTGMLTINSRILSYCYINRTIIYYIRPYHNDPVGITYNGHSWPDYNHCSSLNTHPLLYDWATCSLSNIIKFVEIFHYQIC